MKKVFFIMLVAMSLVSYSQDVAVLLKEAQNFERSLKETEALEKYKQVLAVAPTNQVALLRAAELTSLAAGRQSDKKVKRTFVEAAKGFAEKALAAEPNSADANYVMSVVSAKLTEVETENKKIIEQVKNIKLYADKALAINSNHAKANFAEGKWHFEMMQLSWVKRIAAKALFGGMPDASIEDAIKHMEKSKSLDQYYVLNHLELAKAYKFDNKPSKAIEVLLKLAKLPNRTADDVALKAEGKKLLDSMQ